MKVLLDALSGRQLVVIAFFAAAFGFVDATIVVYLRAATGLLPGYWEVWHRFGDPKRFMMRWVHSQPVCLDVFS